MPVRLAPIITYSCSPTLIGRGGPQGRPFGALGDPALPKHAPKSAFRPPRFLNRLQVFNHLPALGVGQMCAEWVTDVSIAFLIGIEKKWAFARF
jgi:hypothetical protein